MPRRQISQLQETMLDVSQAAGAILKLYELRTEPRLRDARAWFTYEFHPESAADVLRTWLGPGYASAPYRMVTSYWDMAASLVRQRAIPAEMFNDANTEHFAVFAKLRPYLREVREATQYPDYLASLEQVVGMHPHPDDRVAIFARYLDRQRSLAAHGKQQPPDRITSSSQRT